MARTPASPARVAQGNDTPEAAPPVLRRPPLWLVFSITVTGILANTIVNAPLPDILEHFGVPDSSAGLFVAAGALPGFFLAPVIGILADRYGRRRVLVPCLTAFGVFGLAGGVSPSFGLLLAFRLAQGFGAAGLINLAVVIIGDFWDGLARARVIGYNAAVLTVSLAIFPALGGIIGEVGGWRWSFAPYGLALVTAAFVVVRLPSDRRLEEKPPLLGQLKGATDVLRTPMVVVTICYGFVVFLLIFGLFLTVLPILLDEEFGLSTAGRGLVFTGPAAVSTVVALSLGRLRHRFGAGRLIISATVLFGVAYATIGLAPTLLAVVLGACVYGIGEGLSIPTLQDLVAGAAPDESRGAVVAVWVSAVRLGQFIGPLLAGLGMATLGTQETFLVAAVVPLVCLVPLASGPLRRAAFRVGPTGGVSRSDP